MTTDFAGEPQAPEAGLSEATPAPEGVGGQDWQAHVRELRSENARRRKENQELRAQLAALSAESAAARTAQAAGAQQGERDAARLAVLSRRLKELAAARLTREALGTAMAGEDTLTPSLSPRERGLRVDAGQGRPAYHAGPGRPAHARALDAGRAERLLERLPSPLDLDRDLVVDDEGQVALEPTAGERLQGFVTELVGLLRLPEGGRVPSPPVGGEPPRPARPVPSPVPNAWDAAAQRTPAGKARAALRHAAASQARVLDDVVQA